MTTVYIHDAFKKRATGETAISPRGSDQQSVMTTDAAMLLNDSGISLGAVCDQRLTLILCARPPPGVTPRASFGARWVVH